MQCIDRYIAENTTFLKVCVSSHNNNKLRATTVYLSADGSTNEVS